MAMAPLTGLFGQNSSGKTAILQLLLMWKQTVESVDRQRVLEIGGDCAARTLRDRATRVNLGRFKDIIHQHQLPGILSFRLDWKVPHPLEIADPQGKPQQILFSIPAVQFATRILGISNRISVEKLSYSLRANGNSYKFGMNCISEQAYDLIAQGYEIQRLPGQNWPLPPPVKSYAFPDRVNAYYQNASFLSQLVLAFEDGCGQNQLVKKYHTREWWAVPTLLMQRLLTTPSPRAFFLTNYFEDYSCQALKFIYAMGLIGTGIASGFAYLRWDDQKGYKYEISRGVFGVQEIPSKFGFLFALLLAIIDCKNIQVLNIPTLVISVWNGLYCLVLYRDIYFSDESDSDEGDIEK